MKKIYPLGNKIDELIREYDKDGYGFNDVPNVDYDSSEYQTQVPLAGLPSGGYGYPTKDSAYEDKELPVDKSSTTKTDDNIIPVHKDEPVIVHKKKFLKELPPKENFDREPYDNVEGEFEDKEETDIDEGAGILPDGSGFFTGTIGKTKKKKIDYKEKLKILHKRIKEQANQEEDEENQSIDPNASAMAQDPSQQDPNSMQAQNQPMQQDPNTQVGQGDPNAMMGQDPYGGMGGAVALTPEEIGRIFELKKIYARLLAIDQHLSFSADEVPLQLREYVSKAVELFETLISNIDTFKDQLDDIIVMFYKFIEYVYNIINNYYKDKDEEVKDEKDESKLFTKNPKLDKDGKPFVSHMISLNY
jgi:hypothetical protein